MRPMRKSREQYKQKNAGTSSVPRKRLFITIFNIERAFKDAEHRQVQEEAVCPFLALALQMRN